MHNAREVCKRASGMKSSCRRAEHSNSVPQLTKQPKRQRWMSSPQPGRADAKKTLASYIFTHYSVSLIGEAARQRSQAFFIHFQRCAFLLNVSLTSPEMVSRLVDTAYFKLNSNYCRGNWVDTNLYPKERLFTLNYSFFKIPLGHTFVTVLLIELEILTQLLCRQFSVLCQSSSALLRNYTSCHLLEATELLLSLFKDVAETDWLNMIAQNWLRELTLWVFFFFSGNSHLIVLNQFPIEGLRRPPFMHVLQPGWRLKYI